VTPPAPPRLVLILGAITAFGPLSVDLYLPAFPAIGNDLAVDFALVQHTLSAYFVGLSVGHLFYGPITDRYGRLVPLYTGLSIYVVASVGCALAGDIRALIVLRFVQALGGCAGMVIVVAIVRDLYEPQSAARMFSRLLVVMGLVPTAAPLAGTFIVEHFGWRAIFWCLAALGAVCVAASVLGLSETRPARAGASLHPVAVIRSYGLLFTDRHYRGHALSGAMANAAFFVYLTGSPFVLMEFFGVSPLTYSWLFALNSIGLVLGSQVNHWLLGRHRFESLLILANVASIILSAALLYLSVTRTGGVAAFAAVLFGFVMSRAFIRSNATAAALEFQADRAGTASAMIGSLQFALGTAGGAMLSVLHDGTARPFALVLTILALLGWMLQRPLTGTPRSGSG
jgi:DHA1 family bicyclomycin/chloramphenicol resistance-like MFS transporter